MDSVNCFQQEKVLVGASFEHCEISADFRWQLYWCCVAVEGSCKTTRFDDKANIG